MIRLVFLGSVTVSILDGHKGSDGSSAALCHVLAISAVLSSSPAVTEAGARQAGQQMLPDAGWWLGWPWHLLNSLTENWDLYRSRLFHPDFTEKVLYEELSQLDCYGLDRCYSQKTKATG